MKKRYNHIERTGLWIQIKVINPLTSQREGVSVFTYPFLIIGTPTPGEPKD